VNNNRFSPENITKGSSDFNYLPSFTPAGMATNNPFALRSADLYRQAGLISDQQESAHFGQSAPLSADDYTRLAQLHNALAEAHYQLAQDMKNANPSSNVKAVSAHGDAYGAHLQASTVCMQNVAGSPQAVDFSTDNRNQNSNSDRDNIRIPDWDSPIKDAWLASHRAFVMSRQGYNEALFATGY
jgi:hypothetical protein